jgi:two-component system, OmpR family, copper resistance phosphate regulon response regulator CusR
MDADDRFTTASSSAGTLRRSIDDDTEVSFRGCAQTAVYSRPERPTSLIILHVTHILIIEDDAKTARAIREGLRMDGYEATTTSTGDEGITLCRQIRFDAIVLDWMLPGLSGVEVLKSVRASGTRTPVLFLTARDALEDRVLGLDSGADDYLVKPFAFAELSARLRALIRRSQDMDSMRRRVGDLQLDLEQRRAMRGSRQIALTPREFDLLAYLSRHAGHIVTRQMLAKDVWHEIQRDTPLDNVIDVHMAHLRRKVDADHDLKLIRTIRGVGFVLGASDSE